MTTAEATRYDTVHYKSSAFPQTHPDRLAAVARLFGIEAAPVENCRVLEIGCGDGGNLIPMALGLPGSRFVGMDLAATPIRMGQERAAALGLRNIGLHAADLMDVDASWGEFDYIITHGLYAWVPAPVRDKIMEVSRRNLAPEGVAFVSYNAMPGGHLRKMLREMMLIHVRNMDDPEQRVAQAKTVLAMVAKAGWKQDHYSPFIQTELEALLKRDDYALYHDELSDVYEPAWFHEFAAHAGRHGLKFLAEANLFDMQDEVFDPAVSNMLAGIPDRVAREQYRDFMKFRKFRQTLLVRDTVALGPGDDSSMVDGLFAASSAECVSEHPDLDSGKVEEFRGPSHSAMSTGHVLAKRAVTVLRGIWPRSLSVPELLQACRSDDMEGLRNLLHSTCSAGLIELHSYQPEFTVQASERPVASPLARLQAALGETVTTLRHTSIEAEGELERTLLTLLDGNHDRDDLERELLPLFEKRPSSDEFRAGLEKNLNRLGEMALLLR